MITEGERERKEEWKRKRNRFHVYFANHYLQVSSTWILCLHFFSFHYVLFFSVLSLNFFSSSFLSFLSLFLSVFLRFFLSLFISIKMVRIIHIENVSSFDVILTWLFIRNWMEGMKEKKDKKERRDKDGRIWRRNFW